MDPLSVTASAVALIQAAGFTAQTIFTFVQSIRSADTRVTSICDELSDLQKYLEAVKNTLEKCSSEELAPVHNELWKRCNEALSDCSITLASLETWVSKIKDAMPSKGRRLGWRTRAVLDLRLHGEELVAFREKIQKSSIALQTMLHMITLSMSLKSNASQDKILVELDLLKSAFKKALHLSSQAGDADARVSWNLHKLAAAARQFHSVASSTSGTNMDGSNDSWYARSLIGELPEHKQQQIKQYLDGHQLHCPPPISGVSAPQDPPATVMPQASPSTTPSPNSEDTATENASAATILEHPQMESDSDADDEDDEAEDEQDYFNVLHAWARDCIKNGKYTKAIDLLTQGMTRDFNTRSLGNEFREKQIELALCHFFQGDWKKAKPIVTDLSNSLDVVTCNLLHALALFQLSEYSFDEALENCRKALIGKKKLLKSTHAQYDGYTPGLDYYESIALRATIHHMRGGPRDPIYAGNYHKKLPRGFEYKHPAEPVSFISRHPCLLSISLGQNATAPSEILLVAPDGAPGLNTAVSTESPTAHWISEIYRTVRVPISPLETNFEFLERYEQDTKKIVGDCPSPSPAESGDGSDTGDESSLAEIPPARNVPLIVHKSTRTYVPRRRLSRYFTTRRPQNGAADEKEVVTTPKGAVPPWTWNKLAFKTIGLWRRRKWFMKHDSSDAVSTDENGHRIMEWINDQTRGFLTDDSDVTTTCDDTLYPSCLSPNARSRYTRWNPMNADGPHLSDADDCRYGYAQSSMQVSRAGNRPPRSDNYFCPEDVQMSVEIGTQTSGAAKTSTLARSSHLRKQFYEVPDTSLCPQLLVSRVSSSQDLMAANNVETVAGRFELPGSYDSHAPMDGPKILHDAQDGATQGGVPGGDRLLMLLQEDLAWNIDPASAPAWTVSTEIEPEKQQDMLWPIEVSKRKMVDQRKPSRGKSPHLEYELKLPENQAKTSTHGGDYTNGVTNIHAVKDSPIASSQATLGESKRKQMALVGEKQIEVESESSISAAATTARRGQVDLLTDHFKSQQKPVLARDTTPQERESSKFLAGILTRIAKIVGSLPNGRNPHERWIAKSELETLLGQLDSGVSNDTVLIKDIQKVVATLSTSCRPASTDAASDFVAIAQRQEVHPEFCTLSNHQQASVQRGDSANPAVRERRHAHLRNESIPARPSVPTMANVQHRVIALSPRNKRNQCHRPASPPTLEEGMIQTANAQAPATTSLPESTDGTELDDDHVWPRALCSVVGPVKEHVDPSRSTSRRAIGVQLVQHCDMKPSPAISPHGPTASSVARPDNGRAAQPPALGTSPTRSFVAGDKTSCTRRW